MAWCTEAADNVDGTPSVMQYWTIYTSSYQIHISALDCVNSSTSLRSLDTTDTATDRSSSMLHKNIIRPHKWTHLSHQTDNCPTPRYKPVYSLLPAENENFSIWSRNINMRHVWSKHTKISQSITPAKFIIYATLLDQSGNMNTDHYKNNGTLTCYTLHTKWCM